MHPEHIPPGRLKWAQALVPTYPSMNLTMVVDLQGIPKDAYPREIYVVGFQSLRLSLADR